MPDVYPGDDVLLKRMAKGDSDALLLLYQQYGNLVYSMARRVLGDSGAAEEITQDVFLKLWQKSHYYDARRGGFSTWLLSITRFAAIDRLRHERRRPVISEDLEGETEDTKMDLASQANQASWEQGQHLRMLLEQLPEDQHQIVALAFFAGMTHSELAAHLNLPLGTVKGRLRLALEKLRALWLDG